MSKLRTDFSPLIADWIHDNAKTHHDQGWRYVQTLAVNTEKGVDLVYSYMLDGVLDNKVVHDVPRDAEIPSITDLYLEAFVFENEIHDLFGVKFTDIAIDFGGNFYRLAVKEPMTIISPEQLAAREKQKKIAAAKAAKAEKERAAKAANAEFLTTHPDTKATGKGKIIEPSGEPALDEAKLAGMDPEKVARVRAAMAAKAKKAKEQAAAEEERKAAELEAKLAGMDPAKAAKVRAAMQAKQKKEQLGAAQKDGE